MWQIARRGFWSYWSGWRQVEAVKKALNYLIPAIAEGQNWPYQQLRGYPGAAADLLQLLQTFLFLFDDADYIKSIDTLRSSAGVGYYPWVFSERVTGE